MNQQQLLTQLATLGLHLVDAQGVPVSLGRTKTEINCFSAAVQLRQRMAAIEAAKHFPVLSKLYRELKGQFSVHAALLEEFLSTVAEKLANNEYSLTKKED